MSDIIWTKTDESPFVASFSLLAIVKSFLKKSDIDLDVVDISLSGRILSAFGFKEDGLKFLENLVKDKNANIIKLPNISATIPQLNAAIKELINAGYDIPQYPKDIDNKDNKKIFDIYSKILGSAVNPVLRQGNSKRYSSVAVKEYAKKNPHFMGEWDCDNKTEISSMKDGDFYSNEKSKIIDRDLNIKIKFKNNNEEIILKDNISVSKGDVVDFSFMDTSKLYDFYKNEIKDAKQKNLLFSLHLKSSMMKVSDPIMFGICLRAYFDEIFNEYEKDFVNAGIDSKNGLKDIFEKIEKLKNANEIIHKFNKCFEEKADIAMVDYKNKITNFHSPNDVIIDASMPAMLRNSGKMIDKNGASRECKAVIPDRTYSGVYDSVLSDFKQNGKLDVSSIGSVSNIGLMAKKAQEYGSHDKSFAAPSDGEFVISFDDKEIFNFVVKKGDIFRMCLTKNEAIKNWISLAFDERKNSKKDMIFWLDENRVSDLNLIQILKEEIVSNGFKYEDFVILNPAMACSKTLEIIRDKKDCISVTGNVLRDYLTDLFPIFELGTSSKMLSIVPLLNKGGLFETGAGGTAPMLVKELINDNHFIWDSLGEFLALNASLEFLAKSKDNKNAEILAKTLDEAISEYLNNNASPKLKVGENDTRASHFYLALYWSNALLHSDLKEKYTRLANELKNNEEKIISELNEVQGKKQDFGGWYYIDDKVADLIMRPSKTLNKIIG
ncbi:isocitrate dehydrogenase, monomeric [Campylobacter pinnipediorum subsp. caledonicus]|uniref:NADP-dependent isocitrate dehydrogenase n=1 Tax=Campylobacter pinnipediorum TaxID=1965231 RepID=UPI00099593CF|nr:NADP-dependent isocitrate dehydrogenase [Campylobacter pinnipediorum]AQW86010.1 isocitrate dehydrogenase, monomeric [Campylobacter pinnipediorum subsp. caledonicus]